MYRTLLHLVHRILVIKRSEESTLTQGAVQSRLNTEPYSYEIKFFISYLRMCLCFSWLDMFLKLWCHSKSNSKAYFRRWPSNPRLSRQKLIKANIARHLCAISFQINQWPTSVPTLMHVKVTNKQRNVKARYHLSS